MRFSQSYVVVLFMGVWTTTATPLSNPGTSLIPEGLLQPEDRIDLGTDGVLRVFNTPDFSVKFAIPLTPDEIKARPEFLASSDETKALFGGVNGYDVPTAQHLYPDKEYVAGFKEKWQQAHEANDRRSLSPQAQVAAELEGRQLTLPCASILCLNGLQCVLTTNAKGCWACGGTAGNPIGWCQGP